MRHQHGSNAQGIIVDAIACANVIPTSFENAFAGEGFDCAYAGYDLDCVGVHVSFASPGALQVAAQLGHGIEGERALKWKKNKRDREEPPRYVRNHKQKYYSKSAIEQCV